MRGRHRKKLRKIRPSSRRTRPKQRKPQGNHTQGVQHPKRSAHSRLKKALLPLLPILEEEAPIASAAEGTTPLDNILPCVVPGQTFEAGYQRGYYEGGEAKAGQYIPPYHILPNISIEAIIQAGVSHYEGSLVPLLPAAHVHAVLMQAMNEKHPVSLVRLGDGELLTLAHDTVISTEEAIERGPFLTYAGVHLPDGEVRDQLAASMQRATMIGIPESRHDNFQGLLFPVLHYYGLEIRQLTLTSSTINYTLNDQGLWLSLLTGRTIVVIGNKAAALRTLLSSYGIQVMGMVDAVHGARDVDRILQEIQMMPHTFDMALVAAGIAAVILCPRITEELGITAVDFGHLANKLESGEMILR